MLPAELGQSKPETCYSGARLEELTGSDGLLRQRCDTSLLLGGTNGPEDGQWKEALALPVAVTFPNGGLSMPAAHTAARPAGFRKALDSRPEHAQFTPASRPGLSPASGQSRVLHRWPGLWEEAPQAAL